MPVPAGRLVEYFPDPVAVIIRNPETNATPKKTVTVLQSAFSGFNFMQTQSFGRDDPGGS